MITHAISGALFDQLRHGTSLGESWGYGTSVVVDLEVQAMVEHAAGVKRGFGQSYRMTGSREAWKAIRDYAADQAYMEQALVGDFDAGLGRRLQAQADRIDEVLA